MKKIACLLISAVFFALCFNFGIKTIKRNLLLESSLLCSASFGTFDGQMINPDFTLDDEEDIMFNLDSELEKGTLNLKLVSDEGKLYWSENGTNITKSKLLKLPEGKYTLLCDLVKCENGRVKISGKVK